ncbi:unnamed protein product [Brassica rapa subsp. narinosa]|uniref:(rape) hypothetical protein n=1 Tax=Brassica napus TaxID=3708 RepID=A0A817A1Z8_BRANA|nr:unnamed protein product [Brassica napus]
MIFGLDAETGLTESLSHVQNWEEVRTTLKGTNLENLLRQDG